MNITGTIRALNNAEDDFEWYPTTDEIINAMNNDIIHLLKKGIIGSWRDHGNFIGDHFSGKHFIESFLDVGAGDGRVVNFFNDKFCLRHAYGIELSQTFAEELIQKDDVFLIGRDFFKTTLVDKYYSVVFCNPPYSKYADWTVRLLQEANFYLMYLVIPVRWGDNREITLNLKRYDYENLGEFDFCHADRPARARVNLVRVSSKLLNFLDNEKHSDDDVDSFDRWIYENIGSFENDKTEKEEETRYLKIKKGDIPDMVENYHFEMNSLLDAFKSLSKLPNRIFNDLGLNKDKIIKQFKDNVKILKHTYWGFAFNKLSAVKNRLTNETRYEMLERMAEFENLDFNEDNIYSIVLWVIKNFNKYTDKQLLRLFDKLTQPDYIHTYKSNVHWENDDWRYTKFDGGKGKPEKYFLDYRIVTYFLYSKYRYENKDCVIEELKTVLYSLGYPINDYPEVDYSQDGSLQEFSTRRNFSENLFSGEHENPQSYTAFTARAYKNGNVHFKIDKNIMLRFNVEVARLRHWINSPKDIENEFEVSQDEAFKLWNEPGLFRIGYNDVLQLGFTGCDDDKKCA